jgi:rare lipoprotein A
MVTEKAATTGFGCSSAPVQHSTGPLVYALIFFVSFFCCTAAPLYTHSSYQRDSVRDSAGGSMHVAASHDSEDTDASAVAAGSFETTGEASYYANKFHGRRTASGERYDRTKLTAAHRTLPFGTMVRVTNLRNNKSVTVRINDRGPQKKSRIIDLSAAAARQIGMIAEGVAKVGIEVLDNR